LRGTVPPGLRCPGATGALDTSLLAGDSFYGTEFTKPLLFPEDGTYRVQVASADHLLGLRAIDRRTPLRRLTGRSYDSDNVSQPAADSRGATAAGCASTGPRRGHGSVVEVARSRRAVGVVHADRARLGRLADMCREI